MDKDSFWQEITDMARQHKQRSRPVEQLPEEKMEQLESNVFAHIDQLFSDSKMTDSEVAPATTKTEVSTTAGTQPKNSLNKSSLKQCSSLWSWLFQHRQAPVFVMAVFAFFSVGVLTYLLSDNRASEPLFNIPESVVAADADRYIQIPQASVRALTGTLPSERRSAFLAGVTQADLDLIGNIETPAAQQIALWYHQTMRSR